MKQVFLPVFKISNGVYGTQALRPLKLNLNKGCVVSSFSDVTVLIVPEPMVDGTISLGTFDEVEYSHQFYFSRLNTTLTEEQLIKYRDKLVADGYRLIFDAGVPVGLYDSTDSMKSAYHFVSNMYRSVFDVFQLPLETQKLIYQLSMSYQKTEEVGNEPVEVVLTLDNKSEVMLGELESKLWESYYFN